jgi:hypothetical protein
MLLTTMHEQTQQTNLTCMICQLRESMRSGEDLSTFDKKIAELEEMSRQFEGLIRLMPEIPKLPEDIEHFAFTPLSAYKTIQHMLAEMKCLRMETLIDYDSKVRLDYELKKSLEAEDYRQSAEIRNRLKKKDSTGGSRD